MKKKVKIIVVCIVVVIAAAAGAVWATAPLSVEAQAVRLETARVTFTEQGVYAYERQYAVYPLVAGEVVEVRVKPGDTVAAGDVLAVVSAEDYESQAAQLGASIAGYQGQIANLQLQEQQRRDGLAADIERIGGQVASLEAEIEAGRENAQSLQRQVAVQQDIVYYNRTQVRYAKEDLEDAEDYGDDLEIRAAKQAYSQARAALAQSELVLEQLLAGEVPEGVLAGQMQALEAQISAAERMMAKSYTGGMSQYYGAQITAAQHAVAQMQRMAGKAEIAAPVSGVVDSLPLRDQNLAAQQQPVAVIGENPLVEVFVPVREIAGVKTGDAVELLLDRREGEQSLSGTVVAIGKEAQARLSALGVEERKVRVLVRPDAPGLQIGYAVDARFTVYERPQAIAVAKTALFEADGADWVWVVQDGVLARRQVETGIETRDSYLIESGLAEGDLVVTDAADEALREGKKAVPA